MGPYLVVFAATAGVVAATMPLVRRFSIRVKAIDYPDERKVHTRPTPTMGGLGMLLGVAAGFAVAWLIPSVRPAFRYSSELEGSAIAALVIAAIGVVDDLRTLSAPAKLAGQILPAGILVLYGVQLLFFYLPSQGTISLGPDFAVPLTVIWVLLVVNAVNLIDGLDGLAAGVVAIAAIAFFAYAYRGPTTFEIQPYPPAALLSAITAGAALGFLPYNFFPAKIIMGDTGSMLLGLLLASATISGVGRTIQPTGHDVAAFSIPVLIPLLVLAVPLVDVVLAIARRLRRGRAWYKPDKEHIHHRLREIGHSDRQAVLLMYLWSAVLAGSALALTFVSSRTTALALVAFALLVLAVTVVPRLWRAGRPRPAPQEAGSDASDPAPPPIPPPPSATAEAVRPERAGPAGAGAGGTPS